MTREIHGLPLSTSELQSFAHGITTGAITEVSIGTTRSLLATIALRDRTIEKARQAFKERR